MVRLLITVVSGSRVLDSFGQVQTVEALLTGRPGGWGVGDPQSQRHAVRMVLHKQPPARGRADAEVEGGRAERVLVCTREHEPVSRGPQQARGVGEVVLPGGLQDVKLTGVRNGDRKVDDPVVMNAQVSDGELVAGQRDGVADGVRGPLPVAAGGGDRERVPAGLGRVDSGRRRRPDRRTIGSPGRWRRRDSRSQRRRSARGCRWRRLPGS